MSRDKQIEEMRNIMEMDCDRPCAGCELEKEDHCFTHIYAIRIYNAGYRKQSVGEWIEQVRVSKEGKPLLRHYKCNLCGVYLATQANFCPNCGAKMKGGAE